MKIDIPKTLRFLPLQEYAPDQPELAGVGLQVWVDPPISILAEFDSLNNTFRQAFEKLAAKEGQPQSPKTVSLAEKALSWMLALTKRSQDERFKEATVSYRRLLHAWYARLWSQSLDVNSHWTVAELDQISDENPHLFDWLCTSSWALIDQHRIDVKKGWRGPSVKLPAPEKLATPSLPDTSKPGM